MAERISESMARRFMHGDCHFLAFALNQLTGWPIHCLLSSGRLDHHAFVVAPDGRALDVEGWHAVTDLVERFGADGHKRVEWPELLRASEDRRAWAVIPLAQVVATRLLTSVGVER